MEVKDSCGNISTHTDDVLNRWKNDFENLCSDSTNPDFDEYHLNIVKQRVHDNAVPSVHRDITCLNTPISLMEVEQSIYRAKLKRATGFDRIPAEVLRNPVCIDLLYKIINFCFEHETVPSEWNKGIIRPIAKANATRIREILCVTGVYVYYLFRVKCTRTS